MVAPGVASTETGWYKMLVKPLPFSKDIFIFLLFLSLVLTLNFTQTWGDEYYLGLTGIQILGNNFRPLDVQFEWMFVSILSADIEILIL